MLPNLILTGIHRRMNSDPMGRICSKFKVSIAALEIQLQSKWEGESCKKWHFQIIVPSGQIVVSCKYRIKVVMYLLTVFSLYFLYYSKFVNI